MLCGPPLTTLAMNMTKCNVHSSNTKLAFGILLIRGRVVRPEAASLPLVAIVTPVYNGAAFLEETRPSRHVVHVLLDKSSSSMGFMFLE
jgi:hypothetical protein